MRSSRLAVIAALVTVALLVLGRPPAATATDAPDQAATCPTRTPLVSDEPASVPASPDRKYQREGNVYSFGMGGASTQVLCIGCVSDEREAFASFNIRAGHVVRDDLVLGVELDIWTLSESGWIRDDRDLQRTLGAASLVALYYPLREAGLFLKAGAGIAGVELEDRNRLVYQRGNYIQFAEVGSQWGLGATVGLGYDIPLANGKAITPELIYSWGRPGTLREGEATLATDWRQNILALNVAFTIP